jgi:hypothetical protein
VATGPGNHAVYFFSQGIKTITLQLNGPGGVDRDTIQLNAYPDLAGSWSFQTDTAFVFRGQANVNQGSVLNYLWDFGDGTTANTSSVRHLYTAAGIYPVQLNMDGPCNDVVFTTTAAISAIGLGESSLAWEVSPNPSNGLISLSQGPSPEYFSISDLAGRIICSGVWPTQDQIDLKAMATGCYVLELRRGRRISPYEKQVAPRPVADELAVDHLPTGRVLVGLPAGEALAVEKRLEAGLLGPGHTGGNHGAAGRDGKHEGGDADGGDGHRLTPKGFSVPGGDRVDWS